MIGEAYPPVKPVMLGGVSTLDTGSRPAHRNAEKLAFATLCQDALTIFVAHPLQLLVPGFLCLAGAAVLSNLLYAGLILDVYSRLNSYFAASTSVFYIQLQVQAVLGFFLIALGRGAVSWVALHAGERDKDGHSLVTLRRAMSAAVRNWPALLLSSFVYGLLMSVTVAGLIYVLREMRLDQSNYRWLRPESSAISAAMIVRSINLLVPDPGSPFSELYSYLRTSLSRSTTSVYFGSMSYPQTLGKFTLPLGIMGAASLMGIFLIETMLCFRHAEIMRQHKANAWSWLGRCVSLARRHFWQVASLRLLLRVIVFVLGVFCLTLPITLHQSLVVPVIVSQVQNYLPYAMSSAASNIGGALIGAVFIMFSLVFDARLNLALRGEELDEAVFVPATATEPTAG